MQNFLITHLFHFVDCVFKIYLKVFILYFCDNDIVIPAILDLCFTYLLKIEDTLNLWPKEHLVIGSSVPLVIPSNLHIKCNIFKSA